MTTEEKIIVQRLNDLWGGGGNYLEGDLLMDIGLTLSIVYKQEDKIKELETLLSSVTKERDDANGFC